MKIAIISTCYPNKTNPHNGIFVHQQAKALQELGVDCHIIQPVNWYPPLGLHKLHIYWKNGYNEHQKLYDQYDGIKIHHPRVFIKMPTRFFPIESSERTGMAIGSYIKKHLPDIDLIWSHFLIYEGYIGTFVKKSTGKPLVSIALGDDVHAWPENDNSLIRLLQKTFLHSNLLLANSKRLAKDTQKWMDSQNKREVVCIYNGVDHEKFKPCQNEEEKIKLRIKYGLPENKKILISIGRPVKEKGWIETFNSIKNLGNNFNDWVFAAVSPNGLEPNELNLEECATNLGISDRFILLGKKHPNEIAEILRCSNAFVLASYNEGLSNAVLEALASGISVITTDVGGHSEVIKNKETGLLINPRSEKELTMALHELISNEQMAKQLGINGRKEALAFGNYKENAKKLIEKFNLLLSQSK